MSTTHILDVKDIPALPGARITDDGHRHIDLDALFHEELRVDDYSADGLPGKTILVRPLSRMKLAGNAREHHSQTLGETITLHDFFTFSGWDQHNYGPVRDEMVPGPLMRTSKLPVAIDAFDDGKGPDEVALLVEEGDTVQFVGATFRVTFPPHSNHAMRMEPLSTNAAAA